MSRSGPLYLQTVLRGTHPGIPPGYASLVCKGLYHPGMPPWCVCKGLYHPGYASLVYIVGYTTWVCLPGVYMEVYHPGMPPGCIKEAKTRVYASLCV